MKSPRKARKAVLITGAAQRIGKGIAFALAHRGYDIALHYHRSEKQAEQIAHNIRTIGVQCDLFSCDLRDQDQVLLLLEKVYKKFPI